MQPQGSVQSVFYILTPKLTKGGPATTAASQQTAAQQMIDPTAAAQGYTFIDPSYALALHQVCPLGLINLIIN